MPSKKILIVNQPFTNDTGGGITLTNLFKGWEIENLGVVCQSYLLTNVNETMCERYYQLGHLEHKYKFPFSLIKRKHYSGPVTVKPNLEQPHSKSPIRSKIILKILNPILTFFGLTYLISSFTLSAQLRKWLDDLNPDIIYGHASNRQSLQIIRFIQAYLNKPLVFHMMDDWVSITSDNGLFSKREAHFNELEFEHILEKSTVLLSISEEMALEYKFKYNKLFTTFHNPIDIKFWGAKQKINLALNPEPVLLYAGRIGLGINSSLKTIAKVVEQINNTSSFNLQFRIQSKTKPSWCDKFNCTTHIPFVPYNNLPEIFSSADILVLPYDFSAKSNQYIKLSLPTKTTEYMISGTPILLLAPENTAVVKYAITHKWARIVTENSASKISDAIYDLIQNMNMRSIYSKNAIRIASSNHSADEIRYRFRMLINAI